MGLKGKENFHQGDWTVLTEKVAEAEGPKLWNQSVQDSSHGSVICSLYGLVWSQVLASPGGLSHTLDRGVYPRSLNENPSPLMIRVGFDKPAYGMMVIAAPCPSIHFIW